MNICITETLYCTPKTNSIVNQVYYNKILKINEKKKEKKKNLAEVR